MESASLGSSPSIASRMVLPRPDPAGSSGPPPRAIRRKPAGLLPQGLQPLVQHHRHALRHLRENCRNCASRLMGSARNSAGSRISTSDACFDSRWAGSARWFAGAPGNELGQLLGIDFSQRIEFRAAHLAACVTWRSNSVAPSLPKAFTSSLLAYSVPPG